MSFSVYDFFDRILPATSGYVRREAQLEMAENVERALYERKKICCEAEVGTGKSYAYLVPGILYAREKRKPLLISTGTINLQEQLVRKDITSLSQILMDNGVIKQPLRVQIVKGNMNYFCPHKARNAIKREIKMWLDKNLNQPMDTNRVWPIMEAGFKARLYDHRNISRLLSGPVRSGEYSDNLKMLLTIGLEEDVFSQNVLLDILPNYSLTMSPANIASNMLTCITGDGYVEKPLSMILSCGLDNERFYKHLQDMVLQCFQQHRLNADNVAVLVNLVNERLPDGNFSFSDTSDSIALLLRQYKESNQFDRSDFNVTSTLWDMVSAQNCRLSQCKENRCLYRFYRLQRDQGDLYDIRICNHNYLLAWSCDDSFSMSQYAALIIDEAHNIDSAAHAIFGIEGKQSHLSRTEERIYGILKGIGLARRIDHSNFVVALRSMYAYIAEQVDGIVERGNDDIGERYPITIHNDIIEQCRLMVRNLADMADSFWSYTSGKKEWALERDLEQILNMLEIIIHESSEYIFWVEYINIKELVLRAAPKRIENKIYDCLWQWSIPMIMTSATLSTKSGESIPEFEYFLMNTGLDNISSRDYLDPISLSSPFDYERNALMYVDTLPYVRRYEPGYEQYISENADRIGDIIEAAGGKTMVLFTSHSAMEATYKKVFLRMKKIGVICLKQGERSSRALLEGFRKGINTCIFATGSFWEGVDVPGPSFSCVIIHKLPFSVNDPVFKHKMAVAQEVFGWEESDVLRHDMLLRLRQGAGRLIRDEKDTGALIILDNRARLQYREDVKANLPRFKQVQMYPELLEFLRQIRGFEQVVANY